MLFNIIFFIFLIVLLVTSCKSSDVKIKNVSSSNNILNDHFNTVDVSLDYSIKFANVNYMMSSFIYFLDNRNIEYSLIFDSLYRAVGNNTFLTSLTDEISIIIPSIVNGTDVLSVLTQDLKIITEESVLCNMILINEVQCIVFRINENLSLIWENNGVNWKVSMNGRNFPYIDIYTYSINNSSLFIPKNQLINTPIYTFEYDINDILPFQSKSMKFCDDIDEKIDGIEYNYSEFYINCRADIYYKVPISLKVLSNSEKILYKLYNENGLKQFKFNSLTTLPLTIFNSTSILPTSIYSPPLLGSNQLVIFKIMLSKLINLFKKNNITYSLIFGSLLAAVRNKVLIMPYDDDIDLVIPEKINGKSIKDIITENLEEAKGSQHCSDSKKKKNGCNVWKITSNIFLTWKNWGVNWKVSKMGHKLPFIDIYTYSQNKTHIFIPPVQLKNGHIHQFEIKINDALPFKRMSMKFCGEKLNPSSSYTSLYHKIFSEPFTDPVELNIMRSSEEILKKGYGKDALTTCKTSHNHAGKKFINSSFPCHLLPEKYFHHYKNNSARNNIVHLVIFDYNLVMRIGLLFLMFTALYVYYCYL
jgi:hypothetical protein